MTETLALFRQSLRRFDPAGLGIPAVVLVIMAMLVLPLPALLLDILFTFNIVVGLVVILVAIGTRRPLDFSSFPAVLLFATMLRLALNVASTRVILVEGHTGPEAAGQVISAFGQFVVGGNYFIGFVIFVILMIVNFFVVTKGAGRVSEVNARFTLDAMPGKQMAIDADLNAGVIDQETAKRRREELSQEADFFGSMDGASKFVSGDAIAGLLILIINIVGGMAIGLGQHGLPVAEAARVYVLLTIGDGLVAQIPSLLLSLATAIIVTRVTTSESMTEQAGSQLANPSALFIAAGILAIIGVVPGMPHLVFLPLALITAAVGTVTLRRAAARTDPDAAARVVRCARSPGLRACAGRHGRSAPAGLPAARAAARAAGRATPDVAIRSGRGRLHRSAEAAAAAPDGRYADARGHCPSASGGQQERLGRGAASRSAAADGPRRRTCAEACRRTAPALRHRFADQPYGRWRRRTGRNAPASTAAGFGL